MVSAFVDMVGLLIVIPLLPFYAMRMGGGGLIIGLLVSAYAIAQLLSAPFWGRVSDRYGRRPALLVGLSAQVVAYIVFAYADTLWLLLLSRLIQGGGGGTVGVIQAYVADSTEPEQRAKALGWLSAATSLGVMVGPAIGSLTHRWGAAAPGLVAAALCLVNILFVWRYLRESRVIDGTETEHATERSRAAVWRVLTRTSEPAPRLIWIYAMGAFQGMTAVFALFLAVRFGVTETTIGYFFVYLGGISVLARAVVLGRLVDWLGEPRLSRVGTIMLAAGLAALPLTDTLVALGIVVALIPLGTAFTFPCVTALLSRVIGRHERGLYMGVQQTFGGMARVAGPLWAGWAWDHLGMGVPFYTSAVLVFGTLFLGLGMEGYLRPEPNPTTVA
jgi:multidrug resistance protein